MPVKKMDFKSADKVSVKTKSKRSPSASRKKKEEEDKLGPGIPTPKLVRKKKSIGGKDEKPEDKPKEEKPKVAEKPKVEPIPEPEPEPVVVIETADPDINIEFDAEERDPEGKWIIVKKPGKIQTSEGDDVSITIEVAKGDPLFLPQVRWVKGKWNEITAGDRYQMTAEETKFSLTFKSPKMSDSGMYTIKVISKTSVESKTFDLKVGPQKGSGAGIVITRGKLPQHVEKEDADFRGKLKKVQKKVTLTKDNEGVKGDIWTMLRDANPREYDKIAFQNGVKDHRAMLKRLTNVKKLNKRGGKSFVIRLPDTQAFKLGEQIVLETQTANEAINVKWFQNENEISKESRRCKIERRGCYHKLTIDTALITDDSFFVCQTSEDKTQCEVYIHPPLVTCVKPFDDIQVVEGEDVHFFARINADDGAVKLSKDGIEVGSEQDRVVMKQDKANITVDIKSVKKDDAGFYELITNGGKSFGELIVTPKPPVFNAAFTDLSVGIKDRAVFSCEVADVAVNGVWFRNNKKVNESDNIKLVSDGNQRQLVIESVSEQDIGEYEFRVEGAETTRLTASLQISQDKISNQFPVNVIIEKPKVAPKIFLNMGEDKSIITKAGNKLALEIPVAGEPAPTPSWSIGDIKLEPEKEKLAPEYNSPLDKPFDKPFKKPDGKAQRVRVVNTAGKTTLIIPSASKIDAGIYTLTLTSEEGSASVDISVKVIDKPGPPGIPVISELNNECCRVDWTPPQDQGGTNITGYFLERKKVTSDRWVRLNMKLTEYHNYLARRMVEGNQYQIRVTAVNDCGVGEPSAMSEIFMPLAPTSEVTQLRVGKLTDESIELKWMAPEEQGPVPMMGYIVQFQILTADKVAAASANGEFDINQVDDDGWNDWHRKIDPNSNSADLEGLETGKSYCFRIATKNAAGKSKWTTFGPVICAEEVIDPAITVPRKMTRLQQIPVGEKIHLNIDYKGAPKPLVFWKFKEGLPIEGEADERPEQDLEKQVLIKNNKDSSTLFVRTAERWDTGTYVMYVQVGDKTARAQFNVAVVEAPSRPRNVKIVEVIGSSVQLKWDEPKDDGNNEIIGYYVEKRDKRSGKDGQFYVCHERIRHCKCSIDELIIGNEFQFRVRAYNEFGYSDGACTKDYATIEKEKTVYVKPTYQEHNYNCKPEFTTGLNNRKLTVGYTGVLTCAVKAIPRANIRWYKNKVEIVDNPKYKMSWGLGVCQLEIRRPRMGDAGVYMCIAENSEGSASVECQVMVKEPKER